MTTRRRRAGALRYCHLDDWTCPTSLYLVEKGPRSNLWLIARPALIASGFTVLGGGEPIFVDGYCVGAVGVSGVLPTEDAEVAKAGAAAVCPTTAPPDVPAKAVAFEA